VFKLDSAGKQDWLYHFDGPDGYIPLAGLLRDAAGDLFGTTEYGGDAKCDPSTYGCGTVFELDKTGKKEKVLHKFTGYPDSGFIEGLLAEDGAGNLYGTSRGAGNGAVFKIDTAGKETILYNFSGGSDGCDPGSGVILDSVGNLYGVTFYGGGGFGNSGYGVVFELDTSGNETVLHTFVGSDGANPDSGLLFDSAGNLYGGTANGGSSDECGFSGCGTLFKLTPQSGGGWTEAVLYSFCSLTNCTDGEESGGGPLAMDTAGNLYGTTVFGGAYRNCNGDGCGVAFELHTTGKETVLHSFTGGADGALPVAGLAIDSNNNLYGTTEEGGDLKCEPKYGGCGVVFKISP
jgi:uncharacterized repeat protein (TIGR03803 family)